jgi:hypothetical protein
MQLAFMAQAIQAITIHYHYIHYYYIYKFVMHLLESRLYPNLNLNG